ncbi:MAG: VWA domain-containing protein, partial [Solirubrobacteraceae bacterium]
MFLDFFLALRKHKLPVGINEHLTFLEALINEIPNYSIENFYFLAKTILVKNEKNYDLFDQIFNHFFKGVESYTEAIAEIDEEWIKNLLNRVFTQEERAAIEAMGGLDELMKRLKELLEEQKERHEGGNKWIGTGGTSPFGNGGANPKGVKIGKNKNSGSKTAVKMWEKRMFKDLSDNVELDVRNMKMALRRLRNLTREGLEEELDLGDTINKTSKNAGWLDLVMRPERKNNLKVLIFFDVGGSMDPHVELCERLFTASKGEFKHMKYFYFHNCIYGKVWKSNHLRYDENIDIQDIMNKYNKDYKLIVVG